MKIVLSRYAGFCGGVQRAYEIVQKLAKSKKTKKPIFVYGSLVHNQDVVNRIESLGIKKLEYRENYNKFFLQNKGKIGTIIITAHGIGPDFYYLAQKNGIEIIDTTCPKVIKVQRLAKLYAEKSFEIIIIGEKKHKEVKGIFGWSMKKAKIVDSIDETRKIKINKKKNIVVISQTTQKIGLFGDISKILKKKYPGVKIHNTLCLATNDRQSEIIKIAKESDVVIVIGSLESNNSVHLWEIAQKINKRSYFIERSEDIQKKWFKNCQKIGISAGASTPPWVIKEVCNLLKNKL